MRLKALNLTNTKVSDLSPLTGMQLKHLNCNGTKVTDLGPLKKVPLEILNADIINNASWTVATNARSQS